MPEAEPLSPRKTALVLLIVGGCFAVLWPRLLQPALLGRNQHDPLAPNNADRAQGCCDVIFETDVNAIKIMIELCGNILERKKGPLDVRTSAAFASGKLPADIISTCRLEVNATCGVDISTFLQQNVKLGKTYKQILEEVRSYNSSACLKMHFGVPTWQLGNTHIVGKTWNIQDLDNIKQERPPHIRAGSPHPAMKERGRAITPDTRPPLPPRAAPEIVERREGRVRSPLSVYYETQQEPPPIPGMRPPLGGAGGVLPPPKSSVGLFMPIYTICIVMFFLYTLMKILFKRTDTNYEPVTPDPLFRSQVFEGRQPSRASPEAKIVVSAISGLVAEVRQQMEASYAQSNLANSAQDLEDTAHSHTNGAASGARSGSPVRIVAKEYKETSPDINKVEEITSKPKSEMPEHRESTPEPERNTTEYVETTQQSVEKTKEDKQSTPELLADALKEDSPRKQNGLDLERDDKEDGLNEEMSEEEIEYEIEEEEEESPLLRQLRASVEKEKATVKHEAAEVSSIYLEGDIPQQSRLLVADSATSADRDLGRNDSPVVLSGKMTLSLINDEGKGTPEREIESPTQDDDDFTTASAVTQPKQSIQQEEEMSEEEIEEEVEEEMEMEEDDDEPIDVVIIETVKTIPKKAAESAPIETLGVSTEFATSGLVEPMEVMPLKEVLSDNPIERQLDESIEAIFKEPSEKLLLETNDDEFIEPNKEGSKQLIETCPIDAVESAAKECITSVIKESIKAIEPEVIPTEQIEVASKESFEAVPITPVETALIESFEAASVEHFSTTPGKSMKATVECLVKSIPGENIQTVPIKPIETMPIESFEAISSEHVNEELEETTVGTSEKSDEMANITATIFEESLKETPFKTVETVPIELFEAASFDRLKPDLEAIVRETSTKTGEEMPDVLSEVATEESLQTVFIKPVETIPIESYQAVSIESSEANLEDIVQETFEKASGDNLQTVSIKPVNTIPVESFQAVSVEYVDDVEETIKETSDESGELTPEVRAETPLEPNLQAVSIEAVPIESYEAISVEDMDAVLEETVESAPETLFEAILIQPVEATIDPLNVEPDETIEVSYDK